MSDYSDLLGRLDDEDLIVELFKVEGEVGRLADELEHQQEAISGVVTAVVERFAPAAAAVAMTRWTSLLEAGHRV